MNNYLFQNGHDISLALQGHVVLPLLPMISPTFHCPFKLQGPFPLNPWEICPSFQQTTLHNFSKYTCAPSPFFIEPMKTNDLFSPDSINSFTKSEEMNAEISFPYHLEENNLTFFKQKSLVAQIEQMLDFFLKNFGKIGRKEMIYQHCQYQNHDLLSNLFNALTEKFIAANKNKEAFMRFVLRKAISSIRDVFREKHKISAKAASVVLCKRYFNAQVEEFSRTNDESGKTGNEEQFLSFLLPYKKDSRYPTANASFVLEIFRSEVFSQDYLEFLGNFRDILEKDNQQRRKKFLNFLMMCVQENKIHLIRNYKRVPWLDIWIETTEKMAKELPNTDKLNIKPKLRRQRK